MSDEEQEGLDEYEAPRPAVLQAERVRARPRHSLPRRLARAARAVLQSHFPSLPPLKVAASSRIPLASERATGLFRSGALETHIARALGNTVGLDGIACAKQESLKLFSALKSLPGASTHAVGSSDEGFRPLQLSAKHPVSISATSTYFKISMRLDKLHRASHVIFSEKNLSIQSIPILSQSSILLGLFFLRVEVQC